MEAIAPDPIRLSKITRNRVRRGRRRQGIEEGGIEDRNMRYVELCARGLNARHGARIVKWGERNQILDLIQHVVIDDRRIGEVRPTMHDSVSDGPQAHGIKINTLGSKIFLHGLHGRRMIGSWATRLTDPLDDTLGLHLSRLRHHELVLERGGAGVQDQDRRLAHAELPAGLLSD